MTPTQRFSNRVEAYVRHRPAYPPEVIELLNARIGFTPSAIVADIGSGTGISSRLFLDHGNTVLGVEPNAEMRTAAERQFAADARFHSVAGTAEATTLSSASVDLVAAGQAFHWFDQARAKQEFARILRPGGWVLLLWNTRRTDTPLGAAFESLLRRFGTDYTQTRHENIDSAAFADFFAPGGYEALTLPNEQRLDQQGFSGRLQSVSYLPAEGEPGYPELMAEADRIFLEHQSGGSVTFAYKIELYLGQLPHQGLP